MLGSMEAYDDQATIPCLQYAWLTQQLSELRQSRIRCSSNCSACNLPIFYSDPVLLRMRLQLNAETGWYCRCIAKFRRTPCPGCPVS